VLAELDAGTPEFEKLLTDFSCARLALSFMPEAVGRLVV
jgi:hypothetical protein